MRWSGLPHFSDGHWLGIELDEPLGLNNGLVQGRQYFTCEAQCGIFLRWTAVEPLATDPSKGYFTGSAKDEMRRRVSKKKAQQSASASASAAARRTQRLKNFGKAGGNNLGREGRDLFSRNLQ